MNPAESQSATRPASFRELCTRGGMTQELGNPPSRPPLYPSVAYHVASPAVADECLGGERPGYVYQRDGNPTVGMLRETCRRLHAADFAWITSSGMSALSLLVLDRLQQGDEVVLSSRLYGKTAVLIRQLERFGIRSRVVDLTDRAAVAAALVPPARLMIVETISNPTLRVANIPELSTACHRAGIELLVDNTFASPGLCRPLEWGADWVWESLTKIMNGHGDVVLGLLCGKGAIGETLASSLSTWGMTPSPWDCWLVERGLTTLPIRLETACRTAWQVAEWLARHPAVRQVDYPGLASHPDHQLASQLLGQLGIPGYGHLVTFHLAGGWEAASHLIGNLSQIPFLASLGEVGTSLSHPASTSHRRQTPEQWASAGISGGSIRLSVGLESPEFICESLAAGLATLDETPVPGV